MRQRDVVLGALLLATVGSACSRLTFVRPDASRGRSEQVAPVYDFRDEDRSAAKISPRTQLLRAEQQLGTGDLAAAEASARAALKADPKSSSAHAVLAVVASRRGDVAGAGSHHARAAELSPASGAMLSNYGTWLCDNGRAAESIAWFDKALEDRAYTSPASA
ncbi:MAG TPA: type IV pilus biogenesis/stability protein PilW, partial [Luteimonas sp.]|nr:type IV pilus biogenesis/stability protein PilW [Luteimonas sp.]